jgi:hypothetical protein
MEDCLDVIITTGIITDPDITTFINLYKQYKSPIVFSYFNNIITGNITNDILNVDSKVNLSEYMSSELLHVWVSSHDKTNIISEYNEFIYGWIEYIDTLSNEQTSEILKILIKYSRFDCVGQKIINNELLFQITKLIWSVPKFRKVIKYFNSFRSGAECMESDIFSTLDYTLEINKYELYVESFRDLINDRETHDEIVNRIWHTFDLNKGIFTQPIYNIHTFIKQYASPYYTNFLFRILIEIYSRYDVNELMNSFPNESLKIDYKKINLTLPFEHKLVLCMLNGIYFEHFLSCSVFRNTYRGAGRHGNLPMIEWRTYGFNISKIIEFIISYEKIADKMNDQDFISDTLGYVEIVIDDPILSKNIADKFFIPELYNFIEKLVVNKYSKINVNKHSRIEATKTMFMLLRTRKIELHENFVDELLIFVNDVDYFKESQFLEILGFHKDILQKFVQSIRDARVSDEIISRVIFELLSKCNDEFTILDDIVKQCRTFRRIPYDAKGLCNEITECILDTLYIYSEIYMFNKLTNEHHEVDREFYTTAVKIISECESNGDMLTILKYHEQAKKLIEGVIDCIKINKSVLHLIMDFKDKLLIEINDPQLMINGTKKEEFMNILAEYKPSKVIDYPDEFLDPLLCCPITSPVMIPDISDIFDKTTILTRIKIDPINPYTRKPLTEEIFEEYNKRDEIKEKINNFMSKLNDWKKKNNIS